MEGEKISYLEYNDQFCIFLYKVIKQEQLDTGKTEEKISKGTCTRGMQTTEKYREVMTRPF